MKKLTTTVLLTAAAALAAAAAASAKELASAHACGVDRCVALEDRAAVNALLGSPQPDSSAERPGPARFYRVRFMFGGPDGEEQPGFSFLYVPSRNVFAAGGELPDELVWFPVDGAALDVVRRAVRGLQPFGAPAAWQNPNVDPAVIPAERAAQPARSGEGRSRAPYVGSAAGMLLALTGLALLARRLRMRRTTTA